MIGLGLRIIRALNCSTYVLCNLVKDSIHFNQSFISSSKVCMPKYYHLTSSDEIYSTKVANSGFIVSNVQYCTMESNMQYCYYFFRRIFLIVLTLVLDTKDL